MSNPLPSTSEPSISKSAHQESAREFLNWALAQLQLDFHVQSDLFTLQIPEPDRENFDGKSSFCLALRSNVSQPYDETFTWDGPFFRWMMERMSTEDSLLNLRPINQPHAVSDISEPIFSAYQVDGGQVHLRGCHLTDYPFLRLSFPVSDGNESSIQHVFVAHDGSTVSEELADKLGLVYLERVEKAPHKLDDDKLDTLVTSGRHSAAKLTTTRDPSAATEEPLIVSLVWIKHADGLLEFSIGDSMVTLPFSGWAKLLQAPAYVAGYSGQSTFHIAATDDGRIDAAEEIDVCQQSGKRVLRQDLVTCNVTGKRVLEEFVRICPVLGLPALANEFVECRNCQQLVSRAAISEGICSACLSMSKIHKDDPRLVWIVGEYERLEQWNRWQLAETADVYVTEASSLLKRLLIVFDKESLEVRHMASSSRFSSNWLPISANEMEKFL